MRKILIGALVAAGIGFVGIPAGSAAPVNNTVLKQIEQMNNSTTTVQHWRWGSRWRGHWRRRCHGWRSGWWWC